MLWSEVLEDLWFGRYKGEDPVTWADMTSAPVALPTLDASWPEVVRKHFESVSRKHASATEKRLRGPDPSLVVFDEVDWVTVEKIANAFDVPTELLVGES